MICLTALTSDIMLFHVADFTKMYQSVANFSLQLSLAHPVCDHVIDRVVFVLSF